MALFNILAPRQQVLNAQGAPLAGGTVYLYDPGTTNFVTSYQDSDLTTPHTNPVRLSGSGRANIWISRDCDLRILDRNGNLVLEELNANPDALGSDDSGLITNGSFEIDSDADGVPDGWTLASETGATNAIDDTESTDGTHSFRFTSAGNGGGSLVTTAFFPVNEIDELNVVFDLRSTLATVRNIVRVEWYDIDQIAISNSDVYDSTSNPTSYTSYQFSQVGPSGARFAKLRLIGIDPSVLLSGSTYFDRVRTFYPAVVSGVFDNITIQDNEIITTNTNGDLEIGPDGTGSVNINQAGAVDLTDHGNALNIGTDDPANDPHMAFDAAHIQAKADETTAAALALNPLGEDVQIGADAGTRIYVNDSGTVDLFYDDNQVGAFYDDGLQVFDPDGDEPEIQLLEDDGTERARLRALSGSTLLQSMLGDDLLWLRGTYEEAASDYAKYFIRMDPSDDVQIYHPQGGISTTGVGAVVARTIHENAGGWEVNNQLTASGFERALTTSDLGGDADSTIMTERITSNVTLADDSTWEDVFSFTIPANAGLLLDGFMRVQCPAADDVEFQIAGSGYDYDVSFMMLLQNSGSLTAGSLQAFSSLVQLGTSGNAVITDTVNLFGRISSTTGGTFTLQARKQNDTGADGTIYANSWMRLHRIV